MASRYASCVARKAWNCSQLVCSFSLAVIICFIGQVYNISHKVSSSVSVKGDPIQPQRRTHLSSLRMKGVDYRLEVLNAYLVCDVKERTSTLCPLSTHLYFLSLGDVENQNYFTNVMEVIMEDQILRFDTTEEVTSDENLSKKLLKKEQRFNALLQEEQEDEARALERFERAQARLERRRKRVERIQGKLVLVREQIADLRIADQQFVYVEHEPAIATALESTPSVDSEEFAPVHVEQEIVGFQESDGSSSSYSEPSLPETSASEQEATSIRTVVSDVLTVDEDEEKGNEQGHEAAQELEASSPSSFESTTSITNEQEPLASDDSSIVVSEIVYTPDVGTSTDSIMERVPTKPLELEQQDQHAASPLSTDVQSAKEAWIAAESAMQYARNAAYGIATSISFLSQNDGLSNEFMEELVRKQADANKEQLKAQDAARAAYERFVQAQRDTESAARLPVDASMNSSEDHSQQKQENASLPPAEGNGTDQTAKLHAIRLYKEW